MGFTNQEKSQAEFQTDEQIWAGAFCKKRRRRIDITVAEVCLSCWRLVKRGVLAAVRPLESDAYERIEVHYHGSLGQELFLAHELGIQA